MLEGFRIDPVDQNQDFEHDESCNSSESEYTCSDWECSQCFQYSSDSENEHSDFEHSECSYSADPEIPTDEDDDIPPKSMDGDLHPCYCCRAPNSDGSPLSDNSVHISIIFLIIVCVLELVSYVTRFVSSWDIPGRSTDRR
ncbi:hypothetical protein P175DRAFT_0503145 [Aspergillus ochraceoroseus IBT 24754]|uniref:Uncharacterized protein n=1 Tax=Aspergillus ochraceoroseus IBT 24754 TaxID=1392256 RepID=A0A2T5LTK7_9EURO|nr:uncharacterized protein P175DRAFT_0503145 [Aspergillus ochraceoroseus IBT 24754]PTU19608.1 hypothetical protein P175DRAFT_0503145 [Aspergillus ochraceoroseus IBT 24754]